MGDNLTKQEQGFVKDLIKTGNATEAVQKNFDIEDPNYAGVKGTRLLRNDKIQNAIQTLAEKIPDELVIQKHIALLNKTEKKYDTEGNIVSEEIDTNAVKAGVDMSYKLKGSYAAEKSINLNINHEQTEESLIKAKAFDEWFKKQL